MPKTFLITGGAGFIGSAVIRYIISNTSHRVVNIDKLTYAGNLQSLESIESSENYQFEQKDICNSEDMREIFSRYKPDIVMHLAAESHVDRSIDGPGDFMQTNIMGTYILLEAAREYWSKLDGEKKKSFRFHHISTDEVYGDLPHPDEQDGALPLFTENTSYEPSSPYSASKASSDHLVRAWLRTFKFPTLISNCSNNYGPFQFPEKLIPLIMLNALEDKLLPIYGKGNQIRDWLYVDDHARANEQITYVADRPGHDRRYAIDATKIQNELNWTPQETFETGMQKTIQWYLGNEPWWRSVQDGSYQRERLGAAQS